MKKGKKRLIIILSIILLIIISVSIIGIFINKKTTNKDKLEVTSSLVSEQVSREREFVIKGYTIDDPNIILDPYKSSPLTALVLFETDDNVSPKVTIHGKDKMTTITHTFSSGKEHYLSIYGLYPDTNNKVTISYGNISKDIYIKTDKLPDNFVLPTSVTKDSSYDSSELFFYTPSSIGYTCAYDANGDVRWYLSNYALWDITKLEDGHLLISTERLVNPPYYMTGLYEIDMLGKIYNEYSIKGGYHHDYYEMPSGNILVLSNDFNSDKVEDYIVEIDRTSGNIVKTFDLKKLL